MSDDVLPLLKVHEYFRGMPDEVLHEVVHGCLQLHGGSGFMRGTPIERMVRDARVLTIGGGATEVMLEEVAKRM